MTSPHPAGRVHPRELPATAVSFAYFFCVLAAYYVMRPVREQLAAAVGSTQLPWFFAATFVATLVLTPVFAWAAARFPRRVLVPVVNVFFIACLIGFVPLFGTQGLLSPRALGILFFVWVSVFNLFVVSVFWSFMSDIWNERQARRLFPVIALGGTAGAIVGPALTRTLVGVIGVAPLLVVSAALLGVAVLCVAWLGRWSRVHGERRSAADEAAIGGGMFDGLRQVFAHPFMRSMALLMLLGDAIGTVNYVLVTDYSGATFHDAVSRTRFAADVDLATNVLTVLAQLTVTRWMLVRHGAAWPIAAWAMATVAALGLVMLTPEVALPMGVTLPTVALALVISRGLSYGMQGPARESLFTFVPRSLRYKGKNAVDTAVWRFGDVAVSSAMNLLRAAGTTIPGFAALGAVAAAASGTIGWRLARRVEGQAPARD
ncbi:MAG: MFS transporter [Lysobacteraceae bacterium]|nr:MAG: MFS transporter [Xanthomonadaceae bacterium]